MQMISPVISSCVSHVRCSAHDILVVILPGWHASATEGQTALAAPELRPLKDGSRNWTGTHHVWLSDACCTYLCIYLSIDPSIYPILSYPILSIQSTNLIYRVYRIYLVYQIHLIYLLDLSIYPSIHPSINLLYVNIFPSIYLSSFLSCLFMYFSNQSIYIYLPISIWCIHFFLSTYCI